MKETEFSSLYFTANALWREVSSIADTLFADLGLTPSDAFFIRIVNDKPGVQPTEVSEKMSLAPSTITRMIEKLEKRSIVSRKMEGKYTYIYTSAKGQDLDEQIRAKWDEVNALYTSLLGHDKIADITTSTTEAAHIIKANK